MSVYKYRACRPNNARSYPLLTFVTIPTSRPRQLCALKTHQIMQNTTPISRIMTRKPVTVTPTHKHFHAVPVLEGDRRLVGILTTYDLLKVLERVLAPELGYAA